MDLLLHTMQIHPGAKSRSHTLPLRRSYSDDYIPSLEGTPGLALRREHSINLGYLKNRTAFLNSCL